MKKLLLSGLVLFSLISCNNEPKKAIEKNNHKKPVVVDSIEHIKIVKATKEETETSTSYHYKYDWWNGKFRQQPKVESQTKYYIVFTNGEVEETTKEKGMFYEKGDTVKTYTYVYK